MSIHLSQPQSTDGALINQLVASCPPLDTNSAYCNLLQTTHFSDSCVIAKNQNGEAVGFVSGYRLPSNPSIYFLWQVGIREDARGLGLAQKMIEHILIRPAQAGVQYLTTTITQDNLASRKMFAAWASKSGFDLEEEAMFDKEKHFLGQHESEFLIKIGPMALSSIKKDIEESK